MLYLACAILVSLPLTRESTVNLRATIAPAIAMTVTEHNGTYIAETRCYHTGEACDSVPVLAWSRGPALFAFDGERILGDPSCQGCGLVFQGAPTFLVQQ